MLRRDARRRSTARPRWCSIALRAGERLRRARSAPATSCDAEDLLAADARRARAGLDLIGIFHSHPDCDAYFSKTDLKNSCPWYSFVVLSIKKGEFDHANSWLPDADQTAADKEELIYGEYGKSSDSHSAAAVRRTSRIRWRWTGATVGEVLSS